MASSGDVEIERKFDVDEATQLPPLHELPDVDRVEKPVEYQLDAMYFDTADLLLAARCVTLRQRTGGDDPGWHLKIPVSSDERREVREPLGEDPNIVPQPLLRLVRVYVRDRALAPVARLRTRRIVYRLRSVDDDVLAEFCDDRVQADRLVPEPASLNWREWEIELIGGSAVILDRLQSMLVDVDIHPAAYPSKLARALGDRYPQETPSVPRRLGRKSSVAHVLLAYVQEQVEVLTAQDPRVRESAPDSVHLMRVAIRRLRSALSTYRTILDVNLVNHLREELKWLGLVLGEERDAEVMRQRLQSLIAAEPFNLTLESELRRINEQLKGDLRAARRLVGKTLNNERYFRLLDALDALLTAPPLTELASEPAQKIVPELIKQDWKRLRRTVRAAAKTPAGAGRDLGLHEVRKSAKRLRYAVETAIPVYRNPASQLADAAENLQTILGDYHDSVVARDLLRRLGEEAHLQGENGFNYGRLYALEERNAEGSEIRFRNAWKHFPSVSLKV